MKASRRMYTVALGAAGLVLAGSMVGAVAYAANGGPSGGNDNSWSQGLSGGGMMGGGANGYGGMMGQGWNQNDSTDTSTVTLDQAKKIATDWATTNLPGATLDTGLQMPMGYVFVASKDGKVVAHVMVNDDTGKVFAVDSSSFGGMMGQGWNQPGSADAAAVTLDQATKIANDWVAGKYPGATVSAGTQMPIGYLFVASKDGKVVAHVMVNDDTGKVSASNGRNFGGMMGGGWARGANGTNGTSGGGMMGQGRRAAMPTSSGGNI